MMPRARPINAGEQAALLVAALGLLGVSTALASASAGPPAPRINAHPPRQTRARTATFYFSDAQPRVSFRCSLDGSRPAPCSSPVHYRQILAPGQHSFSVLARSASGEYSATASYGYTINLNAPRVEVSFPARGGIYNTASWTKGCPGGRRGVWLGRRTEWRWRSDRFTHARGRERERERERPDRHVT